MIGGVLLLGGGDGTVGSAACGRRPCGSHAQQRRQQQSQCGCCSGLTPSGDTAPALPGACTHGSHAWVYHTQVIFLREGPAVPRRGAPSV
jgi:hypothetical protein